MSLRSSGLRARRFAAWFSVRCTIRDDSGHPSNASKYLPARLAACRSADGRTTHIPAHADVEIREDPSRLACGRLHGTQLVRDRRLPRARQHRGHPGDVRVRAARALPPRLQGGMGERRPHGRALSVNARVDAMISAAHRFYPKFMIACLIYLGDSTDQTRRHEMPEASCGRLTSRTPKT